MMGSKEIHNDDQQDLEWENISAFISDFAESNESVSSEDLIETLPPVPIEKNPDVKKSNLPDKVEKYKKTIGQRKQLRTQSSTGNMQKDFSKNYDNLQADVRNLLIELQEIKQARINLQSKISFLQQ